MSNYYFKKDKSKNNNMIFFTSDTHFLGKDTIIRENRPFKSAKDFANYTIKLWNKQANNHDIIYHLGDFVNYNSKETDNWIAGLNLVNKIKARVILIIGNNEERIIRDFFHNSFEDFKKYCIEHGFYDVKKEEILIINKKSFYLNHFPINHKENSINLFGHTHRATGLWKPYGLNVGCDLNHFMLFDINEIERLLIDKETYWDNDINNNAM